MNPCADLDHNGWTRNAGYGILEGFYYTLHGADKDSEGMLAWSPFNRGYFSAICLAMMLAAFGGCRAGFPSLLMGTMAVGALLEEHQTIPTGVLWLGTKARESGNLAEAESLVLTALAVAKASDPQSNLVDMCLIWLSTIYNEQGRQDEAVSSAKDAIEFSEETYGKYSEEAAACWAHLACLQRNIGLKQDAERSA